MKIKYLSLLLLLLILTSSCLYSCAKKDTPEQTAGSTTSGYGVFPYTFTDSLGKSVTLTEKPTNVAVLFSSFAEIWTLAGGQIAVTVGDSVDRGFVSENVVLVDDGSGHTTINTEILVSQMPDLVICTTDYTVQKETDEYLTSIGIASAAFRVESFDDYLKVLKIFTDINGSGDIYEKHGTDLKNSIDSLLSRVEEFTKDKKQPDILFVRAGSSAKSTKAKNSNDNFACKMLSELCTHNIADDASILLDGLSLEEIIIRDPEYIFITSMGDEAASRAYISDLFSKAGWNDLSAVKNGKVVFLDKNMFHYKPNSRWYEAYRYLTETLYPDISFE